MTILNVLKKTFHRILPAIALAASPSLVEANCSTSPTWRGEPITQSYIDGLADDQAGRVKKAHLAVLSHSAISSYEAQNEIKRKLLPLILLPYKGDRGAFRKTLVDGTLLDAIEALDFDQLDSRAIGQIISAYWLNACTEQAIDLLIKHGPSWHPHRFLPVATNNAEVLFELADKTEPAYNAERLRTLGNLLEKPELAEETLQKFQVFMQSYPTEDQSEKKIDQDGVNTALSLFSEGPNSFERPKLPSNPSAFDFQLYHREWNLIAAWANVAGHCRAFENVTAELLALPSNDFWSFKSFLEASAIRCDAFLKR